MDEQKGSTLQAGPILSPHDFLPEGFPYYPDWGIDWEEARRWDEAEELGLDPDEYDDGW